jgi:hypothetical protein
LRGVAFRSSRAEPFGEDFLRRALGHLLAGDLVAVRREYVATVLALRRRQITTHDVSAKVRLTKTPLQYDATRALRRELSYEALLGNGRNEWAPGERIRIYRAVRGRAGLLSEPELDDASDERDDNPDPRDYDVDYYLRVLRETFAARLARGVTAEDFAAICADPEQPSLFERPLHAARPILTVLSNPLEQTASEDESEIE